ncbi:MAG: hypothetical protein WEC75_03675 [Dehalococcoidia bacterium]
MAMKVQPTRFRAVSTDDFATIGEIEDDMPVVVTEGESPTIVALAQELKDLGVRAWNADLVKRLGADFVRVETDEQAEKKAEGVGSQTWIVIEVKPGQISGIVRGRLPAVQAMSETFGQPRWVPGVLYQCPRGHIVLESRVHQRDVNGDPVCPDHPDQTMGLAT